MECHVPREKAARVATSGLVYPTLGYPARGPASWHRRSESSIITDSAEAWFHGAPSKLCAVQYALRLDGAEPSWPGGASGAPVRREDGDGRERHLSVSTQSCRNRGSHVQFCPGRVDCCSCLALAAQVNGGKTRAWPLWPGIFCRLVAPTQCCPRETPSAVALGRRGWPWPVCGQVKVRLRIIAPGWLFPISSRVWFQKIRSSLTSTTEAMPVPGAQT